MDRMSVVCVIFFPLFFAVILKLEKCMQVGRRKPLATGMKVKWKNTNIVIILGRINVSKGEAPHLMSSSLADERRRPVERRKLTFCG